MLNPRNTPRFGTDPEGFFQKDGAIIGSEKLIPVKGVNTYNGLIVRDGVQFELNPLSAYTLQELGVNISALFNALNGKLKANPGVSLCWDGLVTVSQEELASLSPSTRVLGCKPSINVYEERPITVDAATYPKRSAGGHIHMGTVDKQFMERRRRAVPVFDILVGNTCVLLDRDPGAAERRENYGRAGECRLPKHGLEYRTTSNFWLRDFTLMSMVFGLAHIAYDYCFQCFNGDQQLWNDLSSRVKIDNVIKAIDTNDKALALKNLKSVVPFLRKQLPKEGFVLTNKNLTKFVDFVASADIYTLFPENQIVDNWISGKQISFDMYLEQA